MSRMSVEFFLPRSTKNICYENLLCWVLQKNFGREKVYGYGWGGEEYQDIPSKIFCLTVPKPFVWEPFGVSLISGIEKC